MGLMESTLPVFDRGHGGVLDLGDLVYPRGPAQLDEERIGRVAQADVAVVDSRSMTHAGTEGNRADQAGSSTKIRMVRPVIRSWYMSQSP